MFNSIPLSLDCLRSYYQLSLVAPEYKVNYNEWVAMEHHLFKLGRGADEILEANAEAEAY